MDGERHLSYYDRRAGGGHRSLLVPLRRFPPNSLFIRADFVVKFVIVLLIASSIFSWALIFDKFKLFKNINAPLFLLLRVHFSKVSRERFYKLACASDHINKNYPLLEA